ncbi:Ribonuclease III domain [Ceraceosorus bombacis]|uniref:Ribonuclease III domain n=1 Tax=Ceraceosorus bombacis TaxID=401625 RepID=A0A0P1BEJ8_9BASI|nr:Ribonuclease III domain [Ceraceosorus bombacis]
MVEPIIPNDEARQMKRAAEPTSDDGSRRMKRAAAHNKEVELALLAQDQDSASSSSSSSSTLLDSVAPIPSERTNTPKYLNDPELGSQKHVKVWETVPLRFPPRDRYPPSAPDIASDDLRLCAIALGVASLGARPTWRQGSPAEALAAVNQGLDSMVRKGDAVHKPPSDEAEQDKNTRDEALKIIDADGYWSSASVHTRYGDESPDWMFEDSKRLEWLGDAVVGLVARHTIMTRYPDLSVAGATQAWGHIVSNDTFGHLWDIAGLEAAD